MEFVDFRLLRKSKNIDILFPEWQEGEIAFHGYEIFGYVIEILPTHWEALGMIGAGTIIMEKAGRTDGAEVKGSWQGLVVTHPSLRK